MKVTVALILLKLRPVNAITMDMAMERKKGIRKEGRRQASPLKKGRKGRGRRRIKEMTSIILPNSIFLLLIFQLFSKRNPISFDLKRV